MNPYYADVHINVVPILTSLYFKSSLQYNVLSAEVAQSTIFQLSYEPDNSRKI